MQHLSTYLIYSESGCSMAFHNRAARSEAMPAMLRGTYSVLGPHRQHEFSPLQPDQESCEVGIQLQQLPTTTALPLLLTGIDPANFPRVHQPSQRSKQTKANHDSGSSHTDSSHRSSIDPSIHRSIDSYRTGPAPIPSPSSSALPRRLRVVSRAVNMNRYE
jgi:hypothetical protein